MASLYAMFKTNSNLETDGIEIDYGPNSKGNPIRFRLARAGGANKAFAKALEKATRPHRKAIAAGTIDDALAHSLYLQVFCETVLLGWANVEGPDLEDIAYSPENAVKLLTDLPDLFADLKEQATNVSLYREALAEADLGNSGTSSATASSKDRPNKT